MEDKDQEVDYLNLDHDTLYEEYELPRSPTGSSSSYESEKCLDLSVLRQEQEQLVLAETGQLTNLPHQSPIFPWTKHLYSLESTNHLTSPEIKNKESTSIDSEKLPTISGNTTNKEIILNPEENCKNSKQISAVSKNICSLLETHLENNSKDGNEMTIFQQKQEISQQLFSADASNLKDGELLGDKNSITYTCTNNLYQQQSEFIQINQINPNNIGLNQESLLDKNTKALVDDTIDKDIINTESEVQVKMENICAVSTTDDENVAATYNTYNKQHKVIDNVKNYLEEEISSQVDKEIQELQELGFEIALPVEANIKSQDNNESHSVSLLLKDSKLIEVNEHSMIVSCKDKQSYLTENTKIAVDQTMNKNIINTESTMQAMMEDIGSISTTCVDKMPTADTQHAAIDTMVTFIDEEINSQVDKEIQELQELGFEVVLPMETNMKSQDNDKSPSENDLSIVCKEKQNALTVNTEMTVDQIIREPILNTDNKIQPITENIFTVSTPQDENVAATNNKQHKEIDKMVKYLEEEISSQEDKEIQELQELGFEIALPVEANIKSQDNNESHSVSLLLKDSKLIEVNEQSMISSCKDKQSYLTENTNIAVDQTMNKNIINTGSTMQATVEDIGSVSTTCDDKMPTVDTQHAAIDTMVTFIDEEINSQVDKEIQELQELGFEITLPVEANIKSTNHNDSFLSTVIASENKVNTLSEDCDVNRITEVLTQSNKEKYYNITIEQEKSQMNEIGVNFEIAINESMEKKKSIDKRDKYLDLLHESDCLFSEADKCLSQLSNAAGSEHPNEIESPLSSKTNTVTAEESLLSDEMELTPKLDDMDYIDDIDYVDCDPYLTQSTIKSEESETSLPCAATSQLQSQGLDQTTELITFSNTTEDQDLKTFSEFLLPNQPFMGIGDIAVGTDASELEATLPNESLLSQKFDKEANLPDCIFAALPINSNTNTQENSKTTVYYSSTNNVLTQTEDITTFNVYTQTDVVMEQLEDLVRSTKRHAEDQEFGPAQKTTRVAHTVTKGQKKISATVGKLGKQIPRLEPPAPVRKSIRLGLSRCSKPKK